MAIRPSTVKAIRIAFWSCMGMLGLFLLLDRNPIPLPAPDHPVAESEAVSVSARSDVTVLVSWEAIRASAARGGFDRSWIWVDMFGQEIGPVSAIDLPDLEPEVLRDTRILVVTRSAASDLRIEALVDLLEGFVRGGGVLVLEIPEASLRERFAADGGGGWRTPQAITLAEGLEGDLSEEFARMPLVTRFRGNTRPLEGGRTLLAMDGAPVIYTRPLEEGHVIVIEVDIGAQVSALQQGLAGSDGLVRPRTAGDPVRTADLIAAPGLMGSTVPHADLLERYLVHHIIGSTYPVIALWPWPRGAQGALLSSHASHWIEGGPLWKSRHERSLSANTPTFLLPPADPELRTAIDSEDAGHVALLWALHTDDAFLHEGIGLFGFSLLRRPLGLRTQLDRLRTATGLTTEIRGVRTVDGQWSRSPSLPWRVMQAEGIRYSSSYGPGPNTPQGFVFGTCQPFTPLDQQGFPLRIREFPVCFVDPSGEGDLQRLRESIDFAAAHAFAVHLHTRSDSFRGRPELGTFDGWRSALRQAEQRRMWIAGPAEVLRFQSHRRESELRTLQWEVTQRFADGSPRVRELRIEVATDTRGMSLMIPERVGTFAFQSATRAAVQGDTGTAGRVETGRQALLGNEVRLLQLNPGFTSILVRYEHRP